MVLTLFDLDHTLLPLDTNQAWILFLSDQGALDGRVMLPAARAMKERYLAGGQDPDIPFCEFFIGTLTRFPYPELLELRQRFIDEVVKPAISAEAQSLVERHRRDGDALAIITATNEFITRPVADAFGIETLIATRCERNQDGFTGRTLGIPSMRSGKVVRVDEWLLTGGLPAITVRRDLAHLRFYSDSINDLALLEYADEAIAVNPDGALSEVAKRRGWQEITLASPPPA
jgi:HAD superfamily hydrolase (TIGR01490 family)